MPATSPNNASLNRGSTWHRWDPHIHAPGTLLNDQFRRRDAWPDYLARIEATRPSIRALGVTDYYLPDTYRRVCSEKAAGKLPSVELIFPNIELRLGIGTSPGGWVNVHLLVCPDEPNHIFGVEQFIAGLHFRAHNEKFSCTRADLVRLGRRADSSIHDERAALRNGAVQFKVSFEQLLEAREQSDWALANILIAVASNKKDGTSGVREGADATLRQEVEKFADVIFASSPAQHDFWLGKRSMTATEIRTRYGSLKPCLHGSDAHRPSQVGTPDGDRFSWIKGTVAFDTLRQACIDPANRAFVGPAPPETTTQSQILDQISIANAPWVKTPALAFNSGLVAVIGARGSGKTALAEMIARACDAIPATLGVNSSQRPSSSFLDRAQDLLGLASVELTWQAGERACRRLDGSDTPDRPSARVRYLSQQFVDQLCSSDTMTDALLQEIQRVIFEAHPPDQCDGASSFDELLESRASRYRLARPREEDAIVTISARIAAEINKLHLVDELTEQITVKTKRIAGYTSDRKRLVSHGSQKRVTDLVAVSDAADKVRGYIRYFSHQEKSLLALQDEVVDVRQNTAPEILRRTQERHSDSRIKPDDWAAFRLDYTGDVDQQLTKYLVSCRKALEYWKGTTPERPIAGSTSYISSGAVLHKVPLATLQAEIKRSEALVSADRTTKERFAALSDRIRKETTALRVLESKLKDAKGAQTRVTALQTERGAAYTRVFDAIAGEQQVLSDLYSPLLQRLSQESSTLKRMTFTVSRTVDAEQWANYAEDHLVDLRRLGPFRGRGKLQELVKETLEQAWKTGSAQEVSDALADFRRKYQRGLLKHALVSNADPTQFRQWLVKFAHWLFSTEHIRLTYSLDFGGVDIRKLSPGNRGIVLLLLYLALDDFDDRPLIIDQPEENLDPKSVQDELVTLFVDARAKRQVIMVTHNANLVVNTDADQIIIADAKNREPGSLPDITYTSGGLENEEVRRSVCNILEGGERAFRERARRLRVGLAR